MPLVLHFISINGYTQEPSISCMKAGCKVHKYFVCCIPPWRTFWYELQSFGAAGTNSQDFWDADDQQTERPVHEICHVQTPRLRICWIAWGYIFTNYCSFNFSYEYKLCQKSEKIERRNTLLFFHEPSWQQNLSKSIVQHTDIVCLTDIFYKINQPWL